MRTLNKAGVVIVIVIVVVGVDGFLFFRNHTPGVLVVAAGDIADCSSKGDEATARLVEGIDDGATVLALGDLAYQHGTVKEFAECYDPTWGRFKAHALHNEHRELSHLPCVPLPGPGNQHLFRSRLSFTLDELGTPPQDPNVLEVEYS